MKRTGTALLAVLATVTALDVAGGAAQAQQPSWVCEGRAGDDFGEIKQRASNVGMVRMLTEYRLRWDAEYVRSQCEAAASGQPADISCLEGRRDWDAIEAMIPSELHGMSAAQLRPHFTKLQSENNGYADAVEYCREQGVIR